MELVKHLELPAGQLLHLPLARTQQGKAWCGISVNSMNKGVTPHIIATAAVQWCLQMGH